MREILIRVASIYGKRNNKRRKGNFLQIFKDKLATSGYPVEVIEGKEKSNPSLHLLIGDLKKAHTVFLTGYDTSSAFLFPFAYYPLDRKKNSSIETADLILRILCAVFLTLLDIFVLTPSISGKILKLLVNVLVSFFVILLLLGAASPYNFDRNTAAVTLLYQCAMDLRGRNFALIYVDKTIQNGAYGYYYLHELLKDRLEGKKLVLLDCISNGKELYCLHDEKTNVFFSPKGSIDRVLSKEEIEKSALREFNNAVMIVSGEEEKGTLKVRKTRTFFDSEVDLERLEELRKQIASYYK